MINDPNYSTEDPIFCKKFVMGLHMVFILKISEFSLCLTGPLPEANKEGVIMERSLAGLS
jgi:hypothetical protein